MEKSIFLAQIFGPLFVILSLSILTNREHYKKMIAEFSEFRALTYMGALMSFIIGILMVQYHNYWNGNWSVILTVFGWLALVKSFLLFMAPIFTKKMSMKVVEIPGIFTVLGILYLCLGIYLTLMGYESVRLFLNL